MRRSNIHHVLKRQNFPSQSLEAALSSGYRFSYELQFMGIYSLVILTIQKPDSYLALGSSRVQVGRSY